MGFIINPFVTGDGTANDPYFPNSVLLLGFNEADASTTPPDESAAARGNATAVGNGQVDTAQAKFGTASALFDGTGDGFTFGASGDWAFTNTDNWTIEAWVRFSALTGYHTIVSHWNNSFTNRSWNFDVHNSGLLRFVYSTTGANEVIIQGSWSPSTDTWYHIAADYDGTTLRTYAEGTMINSATSIPTFNNPNGSLLIGHVASQNYFNGWIDELRITKGVARYASNSGYTVPTAAFPRS